MKPKRVENKRQSVQAEKIFPGRSFGCKKSSDQSSLDVFKKYVRKANGIRPYRRNPRVEDK